MVLPEVEVETYKSLKFLDIGLGYMNSIPDSDGPKTVGLNIAYSQTFMKAGSFDIGLKADVGAYTSRNWAFNTYANIMALATVKVGNCDLYGAIGPDVSFSFSKADDEKSILAGLALELGVRYHRFEKVAICLAVTDHQYLFSLPKIGLGIANRLELKASLGMSF